LGRYMGRGIPSPSD